MITSLNNLTRVHNYYLICITNSTQTMGTDYYRTTFIELP